MSEGPRLIIKAQQLGLFGGAPKPAAAAPKAPQGFSPIPGSKRGGYHKREGAKFIYWYPDTGIVGAPHAEDHPSVHAAHAAAEQAAVAAKPPEAPIPTPSKIKIVRINPETGEEEEIRPGAPKLATPPPAPPPAKPAAPVGKDGSGDVIDRDKRYTVWERSAKGNWVIDRSYPGAWFLPGSGGEAELTAPGRLVLPDDVEPGPEHAPELFGPTPPPAPPEKPKEAKPRAPRAPKPKEAPKQEPLLTVQAGAEEAKGKYETTGYVFGSRAELWALRASGDLEKDPAVAYKLVHKEAVMGGKVEAASFAAEMFAGTRPAAAYLKFRLLQAIQSRPEDSPDARERYSQTIGKVQKSLAELRTLEDMDTFITEIGDQLKGLAPKATLTEAEMKEKGWDVLMAEPPARKRLYSEGDYTRAVMGPGGHRAAEQMRAEEEKLNAPAREIYRSLREAARESVKQHFGTRIEWRKVGDQYVAMSSMVAEAHNESVRNLETLGPRFLAICGYKVNYPYRKKAKSIEDLRKRGYIKPEEKWNEWQISSAHDSELRSNVMHEARRIQGLDPGAGELDEQGKTALKVAWNWLAAGEGEAAAGAGGKTKRSETEEEGEKYHTILAQERLGETSRRGPAVPGNADVGSEAMKKSLGLHEVEYGKWVSGKGAETSEAGRERQWHTEAAHAALYDLAHVMGIEPGQIGQKDRLTMAFGSRGSGRAAAEYFPGGKVINITKTNGKGSLAHEWGHFLDYMITHVGAPGAGKPVALSEHVAQGNTAEGVPGDVYHAMQNVMDAIMFEPGSERDGQRESRAHIEELRTAYYRESDREKREQRRLELNAAVNVHNRAARGKGTFKRHTPFHAAAQKMGDYWCRPREMFARCFECYVTDKLEGQGRENTYLVKGTKSSLVAKFPGYFPQGPHRERVVAAMDQLAAALRADGHFQKALGWSDWFQAVTDGLAAGPALRVPQEGGE